MTAHPDTLNHLQNAITCIDLAWAQVFRAERTASDAERKQLNRLCLAIYHQSNQCKSLFTELGGVMPATPSDKASKKRPRRRGGS